MGDTYKELRNQVLSTTGCKVNDQAISMIISWQAARAQPEPSSEELRARVTELGVRYSDLKALADEMSDAADREAFELCYAEKISGVQSVLRACRSGDCYVVSEGDRLNIAWEVWQALAEKALGLLSKTASQAEQEGE